MQDVDIDSLILTPPEFDDYDCEPLIKATKATNCSQMIRELMAYRMLQGNHGRMLRSSMGIDVSKTRLKSATQHLVFAIKLLFENEIILENRGYRNTNALRLIDGWCRYDDLGIAGNASSGKSRIIAACIVADWLCAPECTSSFVASTTLGASEDRIWGECSFLYKHAKKLWENRGGFIGTLVDYRKMIVYGDIVSKDETRDYSNSIKALAFPVGNEGQKAIDETRGRKNKRVRLVLDELAEMEPKVLSVRANLSSNQDFKFVGIANPSNKPFNPHKELCQPDDPREWDAVNKDMDGWKTRTGYCIFLSGERSPNLSVPEDEEPPFPFLLNHQSLKRILQQEYGNTKSLEYWRNAIGFWPSEEVELTIISKSMILNSKSNYEPEWIGRPEMICGFDPAFTSQGDRCAATFCKLGRISTGVMKMFYVGTKEYTADMGEVFEESIAKKLVKDCIDAGVSPNNFGMDISGDGGKMFRAISIEWMKYDPNGQYINAISSMGRPSERRVSKQDSRKCCDAYDRLVTEHWFTTAHGIHSGSILGIDVVQHKTLVDELCSRLYYNKGSKVAAETKKEMKLRTKKSPDLADSFVYATHMAIKAGLDISQEEPSKTVAEMEIEAFESRYILKEIDEEEEMFSYAGESFDPDGF